MKVTVWTKWNVYYRPEGEAKKPKCIAIFEDYQFPLPTKGMDVQVVDGMGYEPVDYVYLDMVKGTAEVHLLTMDPHDVYGPSLL
jgi:hypothetical protein